MFVYILLVICYLAMGNWLEKRATLRPFFKALPICWLAYMAFGNWGLLAALLLSAAGDITLELEGEQSFMVGVGFFLLAHVAYIGRMLPLMPNNNLWLLIPLIIYGIIIVRLLLPKLGVLKIPVLAYVVVILSMGVAALLHAPFSWIVLLGAGSFIFSDSAIAIDKFIRPIPQRDLIVMISYYLAQWLLVSGLS